MSKAAKLQASVVARTIMTKGLSKDEVMKKYDEAEKSIRLLGQQQNYIKRSNSQADAMSVKSKVK